MVFVFLIGGVYGLSSIYNPFTGKLDYYQSVQEEERLGTELSGVNGEFNRTLTLNNNQISSDPTIVWLEGQMMFTFNMDITHNTANSTIKFKDHNTYDTDRIRVVYMGAT